MYKLNHENIIKLIEYIELENKNYYLLIFEYCNGHNLDELIRANIY